MGTNRLTLRTTVFVTAVFSFLSTAHCMQFIYVTNLSTGNDTPSCWFGGQENPCGSLSFALEGVHNTSTPTYHPGVFLEYVVGGHKLTESSFTVFNGLLNPNISNVSIIGSSNCIATQPLPCVQVSCTGNSSGLTFMHISNVTIENIHFIQGCGAVHNSTSKNMSVSSEISFARFRVAIFLYCVRIFCSSMSGWKTPQQQQLWHMQRVESVPFVTVYLMEIMQICIQVEVVFIWNSHTVIQLNIATVIQNYLWIIFQTRDMCFITALLITTQRMLVFQLIQHFTFHKVPIIWPLDGEVACRCSLREDL